ncbi:MAG: hypothetical protein HQ522_12695, partial [Bacteroidetes bacterium]|nr:hypothetical protein [Bacteroidota bacterium]
GNLIIYISPLAAQSGLSIDKNQSRDEVQLFLKKLNQSNASSTKLHTIATSPGEESITVLEIGSNLKDAPAIFVGANFEGNVPLSTEGALYFAQMLIDSADYTKNVKWYILPLPNPDAATDYFASVKTGSAVNNFEINNDADEATNEDGFEDLNKDGLITQMRVKDLEGTHLISKNDPRIMVPANAKKGERGEYKIYSEGIDNDEDGKYNEDGPGGVNVGIAFPHLFPKEKKEAGLFAGQTPEVYGIMRFIYDRPNIAMAYTLGSSNFCLVPPKGGRKGGANLESIKIPGRYAKMLNADASKTYKMDEVIEMMKKVVPAGMEVSPSMVAGILGLGAAVNPLEDDLKLYKKFSDDYKKILKKNNFNTETLAPTPAKDGSFELWAYYHLGVPSFSMNLFSIPKVKEDKKDKSNSLLLEDVEKMSTTDFVKLGEQKIDTFLKANNAPAQFKAKGVIEMMESGKISPKQMVSMLKQAPKPEKEDELGEKDKALLAWSEKQMEGKGFVEWKTVNHPTLGEVEIGGYVPYLASTPKADSISYYAQSQLPWLLQLSKNLPQLSIAKEKITKLGEGIYKLELYIQNKSIIPYPIAMGERNSHPAPVVVILDGDIEIIEGLKRKPLGNIGGNQVKKLTWIVKAEKKADVSAKIESAVFTDVVKQINIGG